METKTCTTCLKEKTTDNFRSAHKRRFPQRLRAVCKPCENRYNKAWKRLKTPPSYLSSERKRCASHRNVRRELFSLLGGKCSCCGEKTSDFLTLEHLNRDGSQHRKEFRKARSLYRAVLNEVQKNPSLINSKYAVYCMNCNWAERNGKKCPHKSLVNTIED